MEKKIGTTIMGYIIMAYKGYCKDPFLHSFLANKRPGIQHHLLLGS